MSNVSVLLKKIDSLEQQVSALQADNDLANMHCLEIAQRAASGLAEILNRRNDALHMDKLREAAQAVDDKALGNTYEKSFAEALDNLSTVLQEVRK